MPPPEPSEAATDARAPERGQWLDWVRVLQSIAQEGLTYARGAFDIERYERVRRVAAEMAAGAGGDIAAIEGLFAAERGHPTPKIDVRAAVIADGQILLVRERDDGGWSLPGGWADIGESPAQAAERETREETGIEVEAVKLIAFFDRERAGHPPHPEYSYKALFAGRLRAGRASKPAVEAGAETLAAGWYRPEELPPLSLARVLPAQIELAFAHAANPSLPTSFD